MNETREHASPTRDQENPPNPPVKTTEADSLNFARPLNRKHTKKKEENPHLLITDLAMHFDELDDNISHSQTSNLDVWILLTLLAIIVPFISCSYMKLADSYLNIFIDILTRGEFVYLIICIAMGCAFAFMTCVITQIYQDAEGSGIPELKSILAGIGIYKYLSFKMMLAKIFGLFCATASGLF